MSTENFEYGNRAIIAINLLLEALDQESMITTVTSVRQKEEVVTKTVSDFHQELSKELDDLTSMEDDELTEAVYLERNPNPNDLAGFYLQCDGDISPDLKPLFCIGFSDDKLIEVYQ